MVVFPVRSLVLRFGGKKHIFRGQDFCFIMCLKQIARDTTEFGGHKNNLGALAPNAREAMACVFDTEYLIGVRLQLPEAIINEASSDDW